MHDLNGFERDALYCVAGLENPNGNDIRGELADYYESTIYDNRLYPALDTLEDMGLIQVNLDGRSKRYTITRRGKLEIRDRRDWEDRFLGDLAE